MSERDGGTTAGTVAALEKRCSRSTDSLSVGRAQRTDGCAQNRCPSAPNLVDHESEMAFLMRRCSSTTTRSSSSSSNSTSSNTIPPPFNYYDYGGSSLHPVHPSTTPPGPIEYRECRTSVVAAVVTPPPIKTVVRSAVQMGFLDDLVPQKGRRLRKQCSELEPPFDGQCGGRFGTDSPLAPIHPEQGCIPILKAVYFSRNNNDLDKENAHFKLAEALISTFELLKWKSFLSRTPSTLSNLDWDEPEADREEEEEEDEEEEGKPAATPDDADLDSCEAIEAQESGVCNGRTYSAEEIAISLLGKFHDKQLPSACDFLWLVSEQDAPQKLLPVPSGTVVDPDDPAHGHGHDTGTLIRGTQEWAPPRPQVIFTYRPPPLERRVQITRQGNRCEGCGIKVNPAYLSRYRYCHYTGKYNCSGCHKNQMAIIPARVIQRWDFTVLPVSVFAYRVLSDIWSTPLYRVNHLYPELYGSVKSLQAARQARVNVQCAKDFILNCRHSESTRHVFHEVPEYFTSDFDMWSMADFLAVKSGALHRLLVSIVTRCEKHIHACELCLGRGFVCEKCIGRRKQQQGILFPWQPQVVRCEQCGTCYHDACWRKTKACDKCHRIRQRAAIRTGEAPTSAIPPRS